MRTPISCRACVVTVLSAGVALHVDEIARRSGYTPRRVRTVLAQLREEGRVVRWRRRPVWRRVERRWRLA